jgi:hypothetical protein
MGELGFNKSHRYLWAGRSEIVESTSLAGRPQACGEMNDDWGGFGDFFLFRDCIPVSCFGKTGCRLGKMNYSSNEYERSFVSSASLELKSE